MSFSFQIGDTGLVYNKLNIIIAFFLTLMATQGIVSACELSLNQREIGLLLSLNLRFHVDTRHMTEVSRPRN